MEQQGKTYLVTAFYEVEVLDCESEEDAINFAINHFNILDDLQFEAEEGV